MLSDFRYAIRQLAKTPGFTAVVLLSLAIGIGSTTTAFCWLQSIWLNPLPGVPAQENMRVLIPKRGDSNWACLSLPDIKELETHNDVFSGIIGSQITPACLRSGERQEWIYGQIATANFFEVLGVTPILGRTFLPDEDQKPGGNPVLVLSETYWKKSFGASRDVIGRQVEINRHPFTIIGVVPSRFYGTMSGLRCDFWAPVSMHREVANFGSMTNRYDRWLHTQVRLKPGVSQEHAQAALTVASQQLQQAFPKENANLTFHLLSFSDSPYGVQPILLPAFRLLLVVSFGVLLIVAANVSNLLLARGGSRQREIAIRLAVGASRSRLIRQLLVESLVLSIAGGLAGVLLAFWMLDLLTRLTPPSNLPIGIDLTMEWRTLTFASIVTLSSAFIFGFVPAWQSSRPDLNSALKEGGRGAGAGRSHQRLRQIFVISEIAVSLMLLVGASLCIRSAKNQQQARFGFNPDHVLTAGLRVGMNGYDEKSGKEFYRRLQTQLASTPGVRNAALSSWFPLGFERNGNHSVRPEGYQPAPGEDTLVPHVIVSPGYFATMQTALLEGRDFTDNDNAETEQVAIVNETMAKKYWPGQSPLGRRFRDGAVLRTVVGVVEAGKYYAIHEPARSFFYTPFQQGVWDLNLNIVVRTEGDPAAFAPVLTEALHRVDPGVETWNIITLRSYMKAAFMAPVLASRLLTAMGIIAMGLAALGVYAVMAFVVNERMREFGLRMALGATPGSLLAKVLGDSLRIASVGIFLGLLLAFGASRLLANILYNVSPFDPLSFIGVPLVLAGAAVAAALLPARKAMRSDPCVTLRSE